MVVKCVKFDSKTSYVKGDMVGDDNAKFKKFRPVFKCVEDKCGATLSKANGWKRLRLKADIVTKDKFQILEYCPWKEDVIIYKPGDKVVIAGYVFECRKDFFAECPYVNPRDPEGGKDVWEATGERGKPKALPKIEEVDAIPAEFVFDHADKFKLRKGDNIQYEGVVYKCLLEDGKCVDAVVKVGTELKN